MAQVHGSSEMVDLIRDKDWGKTAFGPMEGWSDTLLATLNVMLLSPFSFALYWGDDRLLLYNDVYRAFLGPNTRPRRGREGLMCGRRRGQ